MERKGGSTAVVTAEEISASLRRGRLEAGEEKALRMRYGATVDPRAPLPRACGDDEDLADELLLLEVRLLRALKRHRASAAGAAVARPVARAEASVGKPTSKQKIVSALRTRKRS